MLSEGKSCTDVSPLLEAECVQNTYAVLDPVIALGARRGIIPPVMKSGFLALAASMLRFTLYGMKDLREGNLILSDVSP